VSTSSPSPSLNNNILCCWHGSKHGFSLILTFLAYFVENWGSIKIIQIKFFGSSFLSKCHCSNAQNDLSKWGTTTPHGHALSTSVRGFCSWDKKSKTCL
jgi:hypothetical protein